MGFINLIVTIVPQTGEEKDQVTSFSAQIAGVLGAR
jgi:hypothetical protein